VTESSLIKDYARKECIVGFATVEHEHGKAVAGLVVDANLEAIAIYLKGSIGAEAAFNVLTRHAEEIIRPVINSRVKQR
jgi:predicted fused transcriptional regulator/phosphomethylpyrimidine kinase